jgi:integrase
MATTFFLRTKRKKGYAPVCVRVQSSVLKINIRQSTNLMVAIQKWNLSRSSRNFKNFLYSPEGHVLFEKLEEIRLTIDKKIKSGVSVTAEQVRQIVQEVVYREQINRQSMNLNTYIAMYQEQAEQGVRKTQKGTAFSPGTLKSIRLTRKQFEVFQVKSGRVYDFNDIDYGFRTMFLSYLYGEKKYNVNTAAKCINTLVTILGAAEAEGYHNNMKCLSRQFRAKRKDVDNIYLTKEELTAMMEADISHLTKLHEVARDIFMVGVYTAQRVSDYNNIAPENIIVRPDGSTIIRVRQKKTGAWVSIPVKDELKQILKKYDYRLPHVTEQLINLYIKEVARVAGINEMVTVESTAGGLVTLQMRPKYELVQSHTARRTGATLMYLAGMDVFNICMMTGHSSIAMLKKYIKADDLERASTISNDAAFTKW